MVQNASPVKSITYTNIYSDSDMKGSNHFSHYRKRSIKIHNALQHEDTNDNHTTYDDENTTQHGGFS